jgi:hypothetical protein
MQDLTLVGVHDDGEHLVLADAEGKRFRLPLDDSLRTAARRDRAPRLITRVEPTDNRMRPREIQARIRAGQTAEEVAATAGVPLEHVRRYEGPVLAEREYVAQQARRVRVRRTAGSLTAPTLDEIVSQRLSHRAVDAEAADWDAWRSDDGTWTVQLAFESGGRNRLARWSYDTHVRHVAPLDDEARWLTEPEHEEPAPASYRRLAPVRERLREVTEHSDPVLSTAEVAMAASTVDLLDNLRSRRGRRSRPVSPDEEQLAPRDPVEEAIQAHRRRTGRDAGAAPDPVDGRPVRTRNGSRDPAPRRQDETDPGSTRRRDRRGATETEVLVLPDDAPLPPEAPRPPAPVVAPETRSPSPRSSETRSSETRSPETRAGSDHAAPGGSGVAPVVPGASGTAPAVMDAPSGNGRVTVTRTAPPENAPRETAPRETAPRETAPPRTGTTPRRNRPVMPPAVERPEGQPLEPPQDQLPAEPPPEEKPARPRPSASRRQRRTSVPSWDDIVFGTRRE